MCQDEEERSPSLGDFTKIRRHVVSQVETKAGRSVATPISMSGSFSLDRHQRNPSVEGRDDVKLGDFHRLYSRLQDPVAPTRILGLNPRTQDALIGQPASPVYNSEKDYSKENPNLAATCCPLSCQSCSSPPAIVNENSIKPTKKVAKRQQQPLGRLMSYQLKDNGPRIPIFDRLRSRKQKCDILAEKLRPLYALDAVRAEKHPDLGINGVHVFLDMSNINISFQKMIRIRYSIDATARFSSCPSLNLEFLTEILVRKRHVVSLNAGCSVSPGRHEPRYVQELRACGYHVDLRERKRVATESAKLPRRKLGAVDGSSSEGKSAKAGTARYVEDLVDETLQTRIAESVMEHFQAQGTLVLATGDAQPAKYSDGFLAYAERSLKMGWDVEVVSWKKSLSSLWTNAGWTASWGDRFRVIELDGFLDDLLACFV
ncbi:hypothetical protein L249_1665 [Ophiocordyceps polyrhachis-furcata BCC 54312]|uniref:NYN domain-containing protein n=1 Tax=Ophiocordyceps polyrhachis-furcata BCC 54312 TaxID=1330021 RepID=A0A367KZE6_9HYPO|nr:hypothetical protein L249_1665 [Ophiocordyceps polyrhachis-furcata BCC 54312]